MKMSITNSTLTSPQFKETIIRIDKNKTLFNELKNIDNLEENIKNMVYCAVAGNILEKF